MTHSLKVLSLASAAAALVMSAVVASAAQGHAAFTAEEAGATMTGAQLAGAQHVFTTAHGTVKCNVATFHGVTTGTEETEIKLIPTYTGCFFAGLSLDPNMTGCYFTLKAGDTAPDQDTISATFRIECPVGKKIDVNPAGSDCELTFGSQTIASGITLHNSGTSRRMDILITTDITSALTYTIHNPTKCPNKSDTIERTNGSWTGETTIDAENASGNWVGLTVH